MELFRGMRLLTGRWLLKMRKKKVRRNKQFNNLGNSHKIGLVWDGSNTADFKSIASFYNDMLKKNIQTDIICYYPDKVLPDQYTAIRYLKCVKVSDLNLWYLPQSPDIDEFINIPYEILIDVNNNNHFPAEYMTVLSKAEFKVGPACSAYRDMLDMTIKIDGEYETSYYLEQVKYYLEMINTGRGN